MQILFVLGSPRKNGNSQTLANIAARQAEKLGAEVEFVYLNKLKILPCQGCGGCEKDGLCVIQHDDMRELYQKLDQADRLVIVSPVYFYGLTAQTKLFIDRGQPYWSRKYHLKIDTFTHSKLKRGYFLGCAATKGKKVFDGCLLTVKCYFDALDIPYGGDLLIRSVDEKDAVKGDVAIEEQAKEFGRAIVSD